MAGTSGDTIQPNVHAAWRMAEARRAGQAYQPNPKLAALAVGGSVGSGLADQFSDLELDCYWFSAPGDQDRAGPIRALGGDLTALWDYDQDEEEWSEDYRLGELDVTVSNFLTGSIERFLDLVVKDADTDPVKHMRLAALQRSRPLLGAELMACWRSRAGEYPDELVSAMVERALNPRVLASWAAREALVARGDDLAVRALLRYGLNRGWPGFFPFPAFSTVLARSKNAATTVLSRRRVCCWAVNEGHVPARPGQPGGSP